ncbi:MAG TPA: histidine kinase [Chloroflexota bacterium]|nr:histidine kinase [Chloroflexota bacterium]
MSGTAGRPGSMLSRLRGLPSSGRWLGPPVSLIFLIYPLQAVLLYDPTPVRVLAAVGGATVFVCVFLWLLWVHDPLPLVPAVPSEVQKRRVAIAFLALLVVGLNLFLGIEWRVLFFHLNVTAGIVLGTRDAYVAIAVLATIVLALGVTSGMAWLVLPTLALGLWATAFVRQIAAVAELRTAREDLARLAVAEERLRFARDLHDLLGHSLSLISLKQQLAGRLLPADPERAAQEIREAQEVTRRALREVREAVAGYRQPTLGEELIGAREMLEAAGVACRIENEAGGLPKPVEALLAWTVREGTTNVIRHSGARQCLIRLSRRAADGGEIVQAEISDDGRGLAPRAPGAGGAGGAEPAPNGSTGGSGLSGLAERVAAFDGGTFEARPLPGVGFRLLVSLPLQEGGAGEEVRR